MLSRRRWAQVLLGSLVTVGCLALALWGVDPAAIGRSFSRANYATVPVMLVLLVAYFWLKAIRWRLLLHPLKSFRTSQLVGPMMIGFMGNNVLPFRLGELIRVFVLGRHCRVSRAAILTSVVIERLLDMLAILTLLAIGLMPVSGFPSQYRWIAIIGGAVTIAVLVAMALFLAWTARLLKWLEWGLSWVPLLPESWCRRLLTTVESGAQGLASLRDGRLMWGSLTTSLLQWLTQAAAIHVALWSFDLAVPWSASLIVLGVTALGVTVPSSPGFFGVIQACFMVSLRPFGVEKADAFAASVYFHVVNYIPVTLVGLYFLHREGLRLRDVEQRAAEESETDAAEDSDGCVKAEIGSQSA